MPFTERNLRQALSDARQRSDDARDSAATVLAATAAHGASLSEKLQAEFPDQASQFRIADVTDPASISVQDQSRNPILDVHPYSNTVWLCAPPFADSSPYAFNSSEALRTAIIELLKHYLVARAQMPAQLISTPAFLVAHERAQEQKREASRVRTPISREPTPWIGYIIRFALIGYPGISALAIWLGADSDLWIFAPLRWAASFFGWSFGPSCGQLRRVNANLR